MNKFLHEPEIEKAVISVILKDDNKIDDLLRLGSVDMFHLGSHRRLLNIMIERRGAGKSNELTLLSKALIDDGLMDKLGGPSSIAELYTYSPTSAHFEEHINELLDVEIKRKGQILAEKLATSSENDSSDEMNALIESSLRDMSHKVSESKSNKQLAQSVLNNLQDVLNGAEEPGLELGFQQLQRKIGRLKGNQLVVLAARPGSGKTSFMMNLIENISIDNQEPSLVFSLEMTAEQLAERYVMGSAGLNYRDFVNQKPEGGKRVIEKRHLESIRKSAIKFSQAPIVINDESKMSLQKASSIIRSDVRERGTKIVFFDYLQIMSANEKLPRERQVAEISAGMKALAKELDITIVVLCQLNRTSEARTTGIPKVSDLRESGAVEQDADVVILLHRLIHAATTTEERIEAGNRALIIAGKCRHGDTGYVDAKFIAETTRFIESL